MFNGLFICQLINHMAGYLTASTKNEYIFHNISHETYHRWVLKKGITFSSAS
ncbi:hypothetical protein AB26_1542 [Escherichia coli 2-011-08_S1_C2]|nr:hypothetical protein AB26_1542 [Escherichia coli 2-011-08_S1_C2]